MLILLSVRVIIISAIYFIMKLFKGSAGLLVGTIVICSSTGSVGSADDALQKNQGDVSTPQDFKEVLENYREFANEFDWGVSLLLSFLPRPVRVADGEISECVKKGLEYVRKIRLYIKQLEGYKKIAGEFVMFRKSYLRNKSANESLKKNNKDFTDIVSIKGLWQGLCDCWYRHSEDRGGILEPSRLQSFLKECYEFYEKSKFLCKSNDDLGPCDDCMYRSVEPFLTLLRLLRYVEILDELGGKLGNGGSDFFECDKVDLAVIDKVCKSVEKRAEDFLLKGVGDEIESYDEDSNSDDEDGGVESIVDFVLNLEFYKKYSDVVYAKERSKIPDFLLKNGWDKKIVKIWNDVEKTVTDMLRGEEKKLRSNIEECEKTIAETQVRANEYENYMDWRVEHDGNNGINYCLDHPRKFIKNLFNQGFHEVLEKISSGKFNVTKEINKRNYLDERVEELLELQKLAEDPKKAEVDLMSQFKFDHHLEFGYHVHY